MRLPILPVTLLLAAILLPRVSVAGRGAPLMSATASSHPRLFFDRGELATYRAKVRDGGPDDDAFAFIRHLSTDVYPYETLEEMLIPTFGMDITLRLGIATYFGPSEDLAAKTLGRDITLQLANDFDPDDNVFYSPIRLRILSIGYDMFFDDASDADRAMVRREIEAYIDSVMTAFNYERWLHRPYVSNITAMIGASLGLATICLDDELDPGIARAAIERADTYVDTWLEYLLDPGGSYREGVLYGTWSMQHLAYYFVAHKRYDGVDFATMPAFHNIEKWLAFELLPTGGGELNNLSDAASLNFPVSRHHTYLEWAQREWSSGLSTWLWQRLAGPPYGPDAGRLSDKAATVLWYQPLEPKPPGDLLPRHYLWEERGLYYFRTGWPDGDRSDDVAFSFYSGKYQGGHSQEDQNNFTLYGYGTKFVPDNGFGVTSLRSDAHSIPFIDGAGEHYAATTFGTDGRMVSSLLSGYADYLEGDATAAYTTYSEFNRPGYPFASDDWSWGYKRANPVRHALRDVVVVHQAAAPPYFIIFDDMDKDGSLHTYTWRMHTVTDNIVDITSHPFHIRSPSGHLAVHALWPDPSTLRVDLVPFDNENEDPNTTVLSLSLDTVRARIACLLVPTGAEAAQPAVNEDTFEWGVSARVEWPGRPPDDLVINLSADTIEHGTSRGLLRTDARFVLMRSVTSDADHWLATGATDLRVGDLNIVHVEDGPLSAARAGEVITIDRPEADFVFYAPGVRAVRYKDDDIPIIRDDDGFVRPDPSGGIHPPPDAGRINVVAYPNPFNPGTHIQVGVEVGTLVNVTVYDPAGRPVRRLWNGTLGVSDNPLFWDGTGDDGSRVASGVYVVEVRAGTASSAVKVVLLR